jgi:AcrR family transcriptional regulator
MTASADDRVSRSNGRETRAHILQYANAELEQFGPVKFNILRVIENAGVSRSSLYHHFGDRDGLIAAVEVERFVEERRITNELLRLSVDAVKTSDELFLLIEQALHATSTVEGRESRAHRIAVIAAAQNNLSLETALAEHGNIGDRYLAETLEIGIARGIIKPQQSTLSIARIISTLFIGRISVDGFNSPEDDEAWVHTTVSILKFLLLPA